MENRISFKEAIEIIDRTDAAGAPIPFDITFRTLQRNSKTGGRLITYESVIKSRPKNRIQSKASMIVSVQSGTSSKKNPNHYSNRTRNLELQNGDIKKIHIRQIIKINGKVMHY